MELDAKIIAEIWEAIRDHIPSKNREEVITSILEIFVDNDVEIEDLDELKDVDDDLATAIEEVFGDVDFDDEE